jgi:integrase
VEEKNTRRFRRANHIFGSAYGIHPKVVQERLGHSSIQMTIDTYSNVTHGIQEAAAKSFDTMFNKTIEQISH